jgi:hypothetical protein
MTDCRDVILILEDSPKRLALMRKALDSLPAQIEVRHWDNAWAMQKEAAQWLPQTCLISLDSDLSNSPVGNPGDGMDAVQMLNWHKPVCPVIVHTSLPEDGRKMAQALRGGGWRVEQVIFNTREALADWLYAVEELTGHFGADSSRDVE